MSESSTSEIWDFSRRFITPTVSRHLPDPGEAVALELGCREGRRLEAASHFFGRVIGVDSPEMIDLAMSRPGRPDNTELMAREGDQLPLESDSVDFVFSLGGLTRFDSPERFQREVAEVSV